MSFVHLHVHSCYSLLDGAIKIPELISAAKKDKMPAVALTDHGQMFGVLHFYNEATRQGIKPIIGVEAYLASKDRREKNKDQLRYHLVLLAMDSEGYHNLIKLVSLANLEGFYHKPRMDMELIQRYNRGIICLTACLQGEIPQKILNGKNDLDEARSALARYQDIFGDRLYLEIQENEISEQTIVNKALMELSKETGVPLVATNDCHYLKKEDYRAHDVLLCIQTNKKVRDSERMRMPYNTYYFRTAKEMRTLFSYCPEACDNTLEVAKRCQLEFPKEVTYHFPKVKSKEGVSLEESLEELSCKGLLAYFAKRERLNKPLDEDLKEEYRKRLDTEIKVINNVGFAGYFLIVADFIAWAKNKGIPVGPGRGSAAGSLVAFSLGITNVDPIRFDLLFERFLNPERISMPDIDVDFCTDGRAEVLDYVTQTYGGSDFVAQILTLGQLKARAVIRDVGRALDIPLSEVDRLAKLVPAPANDGKMTIATALQKEPKLKEAYDNDPQVKTLIDYATTLEMLPRHASTHASGVVIGDRPLIEHLPLFVASKKNEKEEKLLVMTQFDLAGVEQMGLIKFDFLGLKTLTLIKHSLKLLALRGIHEDMDTIDTNDPLTFKLFQSGNLSGVFQMEQRGFRQYIMSLAPNKLEDIIGLLALYRPGPLGSGQGEQYVKVRRGLAKPEYLHESLKPILEETYGVILYQEQVMRIAQLLADFSLGEADKIRRAMGKKKKAEMDEIRPKFIERCVAKGLVDAKTAGKIFQHLEKFAEYGFNKSHSAAYAMVSYQTAYLKAHYPVEFMAALMTSEHQDHEKIASLIDECRKNGIKVLPPDVNISLYHFSVKDGQILFGLGAIKGVGEGAIEIIEKARSSKPFTDLFDFCERVAGGKVNKRCIEALIKSGALDNAGGAPREVLLATLENAMRAKSYDMTQADSCHSFNDLFAFGGLEVEKVLKWMPAEPFGDTERLNWEKELLGYYVTGHPLARFEDAIRALSLSSVQDCLNFKEKRKVCTAGLITEVKKKLDKNLKEYAFARLEDIKGSIELVIWSRAWSKIKDLPLEGRMFVVEGLVQPKTQDTPFGGAKIVLEEVWDLEEEIEEKIRSVIIKVPFRSLKVLIDLIKSQKLMAKKPKGPTFYLRIHDSTSGEGIFELDTTPKLTLPFITEINKVLGQDALNFSSDASPPIQ
ncbi:MAG: DNA polymerase III subunit alpha [Deltaproteobacteria bacterium]|jgi:DNA polymerase-3 subunit alpha|nr:DNA polymerase III subunit alpha [Deltaproteobacteria bacterium]